MAYLLNRTNRMSPRRFRKKHRRKILSKRLVLLSRSKTGWMCLNSSVGVEPSESQIQRCKKALVQAKKLKNLDDDTDTALQKCKQEAILERIQMEGKVTDLELESLRTQNSTPHSLSNEAYRSDLRHEAQR